MSSDRTSLTRPVTVSVVLPTMNEAENVGELCQWFYRLKQNYPQLAEAIFVLNNTTDGTEKVLEDLSRRPEPSERPAVLILTSPNKYAQEITVERSRNRLGIALHRVCFVIIWTRSERLPFFFV